MKFHGNDDLASASSKYDVGLLALFIFKWYYNYLTLCLKARNKAISKALDAVLKVCRVPSTPVSAVCAWDCLLAHETDIQDIFGIVAVITGEAIIREAKVAHRNG